jgi:hypothetical protein
MQYAAAGASCLACVVGKIAIVGQQQIVKVASASRVEYKGNPPSSKGVDQNGQNLTQ